MLMNTTNGTNVQVAITVWDSIAEALVSRVETWTRAGSHNGNLPVLRSPEGHACQVFESGRVHAWPNLRRQLGMSGISGEGIQVVS